MVATNLGMMANWKLQCLCLMTHDMDCYQWGIETLPLRYDMCLSCSGGCVKEELGSYTVYPELLLVEEQRTQNICVVNLFYGRMSFSNTSNVMYE